MVVKEEKQLKCRETKKEEGNERKLSLVVALRRDFSCVFKKI